VQRQSTRRADEQVYGRVAGYEDTNDAERLAQDPDHRVERSGSP